MYYYYYELFFSTISCLYSITFSTLTSYRENVMDCGSSKVGNRNLKSTTASQSYTGYGFLNNLDNNSVVSHVVILKHLPNYSSHYTVDSINHFNGMRRLNVKLHFTLLMPLSFHMLCLNAFSRKFSLPFIFRNRNFCELSKKTMNRYS